jgi:hypothetical protein
MPLTINYRWKDKIRTERVGPAKAIRLFCAECNGWCEKWQDEVDNCKTELCPLHRFRLGRDPSRSRR